MGFLLSPSKRIRKQKHKKHLLHLPYIAYLVLCPAFMSHTMVVSLLFCLENSCAISVLQGGCSSPSPWTPRRQGPRYWFAKTKLWGFSLVLGTPAGEFGALGTARGVEVQASHLVFVAGVGAGHSYRGCCLEPRSCFRQFRLWAALSWSRPVISGFLLQLW